MASIPNDRAVEIDLHPETTRSLNQYRRRRRFFLLVRGSVAAFVTLVLGFVVVALMDHMAILSDGLRWCLSGLCYLISGSVAWWTDWSKLRDTDPRSLAKRMQSGSDRLRDDVLSAVELSDPNTSNGSFAFRQNLQRRVGQRLATMDLPDLLPGRLLRRPLLIAFLVLAALLAVSAWPDVQAIRRFARAALPGMMIERASLTRLQILEPSPPGRFVAAGDSVGIIVAVSGRPADRVTLRQRILIPRDPENPGGRIQSVGQVREISMTERSVSDVAAEFDQQKGLHAANVSVGAHPVEYQIVAGDAITLWHRLIPIARPKVVLFEKVFRRPAYAKIPDRTEKSDSGDLQALLGSMAELVIHFDQPVREATLRYSGTGFTMMEPVDENQTAYRTEVPIKTASSYQVTAISTKSGLGNPFSRQHSIVPIPDLPPQASWKDRPSTVQLVSPIQQITMTGTANDDLPIDRLVHEYQINDGNWVRREMDLEVGQKSPTKTWQWDLLHPDGDEEAEYAFRPGDRLLTRFVAIDRRGQRGESKLLELLVVDKGFEPNRHERLERMTAWARESHEFLQVASAWTESLAEKLNAFDGTAQQNKLAMASAVAEQTAAIRRTEEIHTDLMDLTIQLMDSSPSATQSKLLEEAAVGLIAIRNGQLNLAQAMQEVLVAIPEGAPVLEGRGWERLVRQFTGHASRESSQLQHLTNHLRGFLDLQLCLHRLRDLNHFVEGLETQLENQEPTPGWWKRLLRVVDGRLQTLDELIRDKVDLTPERSRGFHQQWLEFSAHWRDRIRLASQLGQSVEARRSLATELLGLVRQYQAQRIAEGSLVESFARTEKRVLQGQTTISQALHDLALLVQENGRGQSALNPNPLIDAWVQNTRLRESIHRDRRPFDLAFAADLNLVANGVRNVMLGQLPSRQDVGDQEVESSPQAIHESLRDLGDAFRILEARTQIHDAVEHLRAIASEEALGHDIAIRRIRHPAAYQRISGMLEIACKELRSSQPIRKSSEYRDVLKRIEAAGKGNSFQTIRKRLVERLWKNKTLVSAERMLDTQAKELETDLEILEPVFQQARQTLQRYNLSIPEMARAAKEKTDQTRSHLSQQDEPGKQEREHDGGTANERILDERLEQTWEMSDAIVSGLVDRANQADLLNDQERQAVRDADMAAEMLQATLKDAQQRAKQEDQDALASDLEKLSQQLSLVADHFDALEAGDAVQATRQRLQEESMENAANPNLDNALARAEALASAANQNPEELLRQLEETLQRDEAMQGELDRIARESVAEAEQLLRENGEAEQQLARDFERTDGRLLEKKTRLSQQMQMAVREIMETKSTLLDPSQSASHRGEDPTSVALAKQAAELLGQAVTLGASAGAHRSLRELLQAGSEFSDALQGAQKVVEDAGNVAGAQSKRDLFQNQDRRNNAARQSDQQARQIRSRRKQSAEKMVREWAKLRRQAGTRLQSNLRLQREVQNKIRALERNGDSKESQSAEEITAALEMRLDQLKEAERETRQTIEYLRDEEQHASDLGKQIAKQTIPELDELNPASQLAENLLGSAQASLESTRRRLLESLSDSIDPDSFRASEDSVREAIDQQSQITQELNEISELIQRAGRHETRLDKEALAKQLRLADTGMENVLQADTLLRAAAEDSAMSPDAVDQVEKAADALRSQADDIRQLLSAFDTSRQSEPNAGSDQETTQKEEGSQPSQAQPGEVTQDENLQSRKLAKTLDELDRSMNSTMNSTTTPAFEPDRLSDASTSANARQSPSSGEDPAESRKNSPGSMALDSSPTLAQAVRDQQQDLAKNRQQALMPSPFRKDSGEGQGDVSSQNGSVSGTRNDSSMPDGQSLDTSGIIRTGSAWGQLREQRSEDVVTDSSDLIAPQYRADVEAYFRAIAAQSGDE